MKIKNTYFVFYFIVLYSFSQLIHGNEIKISSQNTTIQFSVSHIGKTTVFGEFKDVDGKIIFKNKKIEHISASIPIKSIETKNKIRNKYLKSNRFLDEKNFPNIMFSSQRFSSLKNKIIASGILEIHGVTQNVRLELQDDGSIITANYQLNRFDYGLLQHKRMIGQTVNVSIIFKK